MCFLSIKASLVHNPFVFHDFLILHLAVTHCYKKIFCRFVNIISPTGVFIVCLSAAGLTRMAAATAHCHNFFKIIPEYQPYLFPKRHFNAEIC